jgi:hypothetical protein
MKKSNDRDLKKISDQELDQRLNDCYESLYQRALELCMEHDSQIVASTMLAQALRIYKTILAPEDFEAMILTVTETAARIEPYKASNIH